MPYKMKVDTLVKACNFAEKIAFTLRWCTL